ncbi:MAG TPA: hypothetical protein VGC76_12405 [Pyrinomonadaceae bacterium]|jgi:hypothetical protein
MKNLKKRILLVSAAAVGLFFIGVCFFFGLSHFLYSSVEDWVTSRLGLDYYLAQLFSTAIVIALTAIFPMLAWYLIFGKKRFYGALALIGIQAAICLLIYTVGGKVCFDRRTGKPLCWFADTDKGRVWSYTPGFEPESGKPFKLFTREFKDAEEVKSKR